MKIKLLILFLILPFFLFSQNAQDEIKTLKTELKTSPSQKRTAQIYSDLTWYYADVSVDSAIVYGQKALVLAKKINDTKLLSQVYSDLGATYFRDGNFNKSNLNYTIAKKIRLKNKDYEGVAKININLASVFVSNQEYNKAVKSYLNAIHYFEGKNDTIASVTKVNLAVVFEEIKDVHKSLKILNEIVPFLEKNKIYDNLANAYISMGNNYSFLNNIKKAEYYYKKALQLAINDDDELVIITSYTNLGSLKLDQNKPLEAIQIYDKAKTHLTTLNTEIDFAIFEIDIAKAYLQIKKFEKAKLILNKNKPIFIKEKNKKYLVVTYKRLIETYLFLNKPDSASYYLKAYEELKDNLTHEEHNKLSSELETKYQTEKKEKIILEKEIENKQKSIWIIIISILTLASVLLGYLFFRQQKLKNIHQKQEYKLKKAITKIENQNKLQDQRLAISRDLHDNIGAQLTFIISSVDNIKYAFDITNEKLDNKLATISGFAKDTILELRDTIWAMNSNEITFEDLEIRINNYIEKAKEAKNEISFSFAIEDSLKSEKLSSIQGMNIYRTIQEAVNNSIKYANATVISVNAKRIDNQIKITVQDNGVGFDIETIEKGNGLQNMQKRIEEINGEFTISSSNEGTRVEIHI